MQVPVDMVVNAMLAAMAKHACKPGLEVYQVASSLVNPLSFPLIASSIGESFQESPLIDGNGQSVDARRFKLHQTFDSFMDAVHKRISGAKVWQV
jgi:fatty acyl-CoA reductase